MSKSSKTSQASEMASSECIPVDVFSKSTGQNQEDLSTTQDEGKLESPIESIDLGLMQTIARLWLGQNADQVKTFYLATIFSTILSLCDCCSDLAVAIQLIKEGELMLGITVLLLDYLPMWQVLLHATTSTAWKDMESPKERWVTGLILIVAPFAFPLLQLHWLLNIKSAERGTFNYLHQNSKVAELVSGTVESPLQFMFLILLYSYNKLPLPWAESTIFKDAMGNEFHLGAVPGILSFIFSTLTIIKNAIDVAEAKTRKDAISYVSFSFMTFVFRISGYVLVMIIFRQYSLVMFALVAFATLTVIVRFDMRKTRGFSLCTTFLVGLFIPCAVSIEPHKSQYKHGVNRPTEEATKNRRILTGTIAMWTVPIILFFNGVLFAMLSFEWYRISSDLLMDERDSKTNIRFLILFLVLPTGICSFIGAFCIKKENRHIMTTTCQVLMAILTLMSLSGSLFKVFEVDSCSPSLCPNFNELCRNDIISYKCEEVPCKEVDDCLRLQKFHIFANYEYYCHVQEDQISGMCKVEEDNIYSFGGYVDGVRSNNVEVTSFRHDNKQICRIPDLPEPVFGHSTIKTQSGVVSCGGEDNNNLATNKCWKLSRNNEWVPFPSMIVKRDDFAMVEGMGQIFSVGGYMDDLSSIEWISIQDGKKWVKQAIPFDIIGHCISKYSRTRFLLTGGYLKSKQQSGSETTASTKWFDMQNMKWSDGPTMEHKRVFHACTTITGNKEHTGGVVVAGGDGGGTVEFLEFGSNKWITVGKTPLPNLHVHTVTPANSPEYILYSVGGKVSTFDRVNGIYGLTHSYSWKLVGNLTFDRSSHTSLSLKQKEILSCK